MESKESILLYLAHFMYEKQGNYEVGHTMS